MQDQWSSYYQGQVPPQASTSTNYDYSQLPQQPQQQHHHQQQQQQQVLQQQILPQQMSQQSPNKILLSLASSQGSSQEAMDASAVFQPQQQQIQELAQQPFSVQDIQQKREEVKSQMKQFLTSLSSMAKAKQFSMDQARAAAEQVRAEAVKK